MINLGMKKDGSGWYLFKAIFGVLFSLLLLYGAIPMLVLMFVDYPALEQATVIEGTLHVEQDPFQKGGRRSLGGMPHPRNYVIDSQGVSHKVFWGVKGAGHGVFVESFEGLKAKVWFHPWYGVIQDEYEKTPEIKAKFEKKYPPEKWGKAVDNPESAARFKDKFGSKYDKDNEVKFLEYKSRDYIWGLLIFLVVFIYTIYCFVRFFKIKQLEKGLKNG